jgi:uncharacterized protein (TIGR03083 family)
VTLTDEQLLAAFDHAVAAFAALPPERAASPVPACPGWSLADLLEHQGGVHRWASLVLTTRPETRPARDRTPLPAAVDRWAYLTEGAAELRALLAATDFDETVWTFAGHRPARWWLRRQAHETVVHAGDGAEAVGTAFVADPAVAADGVAEVFEVFTPLLFDAAAFGGTGETAHLHATDTEGEWLLRFGPDGVAVTAEHAKGDVAARGPAAELERLAWGRPRRATVEVFGDASILDRYETVVNY